MTLKDEVRRQVLDYFYTRSKGEEGAAVKISDVKRELKKKHGLKPHEVKPSLAYLIDDGLVRTFEIPLRDGRTGPVTTYYFITPKGIDRIEGGFHFESAARHAIVNIQGTGARTTTLSAGNEVLEQPNGNSLLIPDYFADLEGSGRYVVNPLLLVDNVQLVIPPEGWRPSIAYITRWSSADDIKSQNHWLWPRSPRELIGLSAAALQTIRDTSGIQLIEWDPTHDRELAQIEVSGPVRTILHGDLRYFGLPTNSWLRSAIGAYTMTWSRLLAQRSHRGTIELAIREPSEMRNLQPINLTHLSAREAVSLALPPNLRLTLHETIDLRRELEPKLAPFWRTIRRLRSELEQLPGASRDQSDPSYQAAREEAVRVLVDAALGTNLEAWSEEIAADLNKFAPGGMAQVKRWD